MVILLGASVIEEEDYQKSGPSTTFRRHIRVSSWCSDPGDIASGGLRTGSRLHDAARDLLFEVG